MASRVTTMEAFLLERVGFGAVLVVERPLDEGGVFFETLGLLAGTIGGDQTVPAAELAAIISVVEYSSGDITIVTDHENHVESFSKGKIFT